MSPQPFGYRTTTVNFIALLLSWEQRQRLINPHSHIPLASPSSGPTGAGLLKELEANPPFFARSLARDLFELADTLISQNDSANFAICYSVLKRMHEGMWIFPTYTDRELEDLDLRGKRKFHLF